MLLLYKHMTYLRMDIHMVYTMAADNMVDSNILVCNNSLTKMMNKNSTMAYTKMMKMMKMNTMLMNLNNHMCLNKMLMNNNDVLIVNMNCDLKLHLQYQIKKDRMYQHPL